MFTEFQLDIYDSFTAIEKPWRQFETCSVNFAFQSYDWLSTWHNSIANPAELQLCLAVITSNTDTVIMILPLGIQNHGSIKYLTWLGGQVSDYHAPLLRSDCDKTITKAVFLHLWQQVCAKLPRFDAIHFEKMPLSICGQLNPFSYLPYTANASNAHYTALGSDFDQFIRSRLSNNAIKSTKRSERRIEDHGKMEFVIATQPGQITKLLTGMIKQKSRSYQELGVANLFAKTEISDFFKTISVKHNQLVHLSALLLNGQILATHWGLVYKGRFYYLYPTYERNDLSKYSPGTALLWRLMNWCIENNIELYDFTIGDETYKDKWCDSELKLVDYYQSKNLRGCLLIWPLLASKNLKRFIKQSPMLWQKAQTARSYIAKLKRLIS